tara:strand:+ start:3243 stop:3965 length:723 start_codon:yes stop_codon:yes gene_type:complete
VKRAFDKEHIIGVIGLLMLAYGCWKALFVVPAMNHFGEVGRIFFMHVPTAWNALLILTGSFILAIGALFNRKPSWDAALTGSVEVGVLYTALLVVQGSIWARPTFGIWWTWDPRLITAAILLIAFAGVLSARSFANNQGQRLRWTAVATIVAYIDVPIVYFIVKWLPRGIHQPHSFPSTVSTDYHLALRFNAIAMLLLGIWMTFRRARWILQQNAATAMSAAPGAALDAEGRTMVAGVEE